MSTQNTESLYVLGLGRILFWPDTGYPANCTCRYPAGYTALTGYPADHPISGRITGYLGRKQTFCHKIFCTIPYYALGAQITAPNFGFLKKNKERNLCVSCLF